MPETRLGAARLAWIVGMAALTLGLGLGGGRYLTYHEAFVAQASREMVASGRGLIPTIGDRPWLEKPPLAVWLVALLGRVTGEVDEVVARAPSAVAGTLLAVGVATLAAGRFGASVGLLAGLVQATTLWTVLRGRLAEADMLLACLVTWTVLAFDRMRDEADGSRPWRWAFFAGLGLTALAKGIGFGAVLIAAVVVVVLVWERDRATLRKLVFLKGWGVAGALALTWPILVIVRYPTALGLWTLHIADRLAARPEHFAGGSPWWQYGPALLGQALPWTPLALVGAWRSLRRAVDPPGGTDRLLWAWAVAPVVLLSLATVKNGHYAIYALPPWSVWTALSLARLGSRLRARGWAPEQVRLAARAGFAGLGLACGLGFAWLGPWLDHRGVEWAFYEAAGQTLRVDEPLVLLYDDWDRDPYPTPFGPVPHDLAVRLYYFDRPACWRTGVEALAARPPAPGPEAFAVLGRDRDLPALRRLGRVETVLEGPRLRSRASRVDDRTFALYRVTPEVVATLDTDDWQ
ncbi:Dolichyl-phosphate-mannose-protein mannosyltransferase [Singulisphaera sp. GP187]|uniref:ArnT family glycosyltransferase n=1 Tax=Singulisphaera sp. GP187 TaxID=1882752 RepID=UPI000928A710|nr:glycosyltransferase family 39 protein [Singulisphaera sp. GP187]SIO36484.1 Dolichyl-phosphate-mannose-protein mannosyltransferase [Singulisphaera sp. GP187]